MGKKLPKYCSVFGGFIYFRYRGDLTRMPDNPNSDEFKVEYERLFGIVQRGLNPKVTQRIKNNELDQLFLALETGAKRRAKKNGREYTLPKYWGADKYTFQEGYCAISGILMRKPIRTWDPYGPSIDRIDSAMGYTPENCQLTTFAVNRAKNQMSHEELLEFCEGVVRKHRRTKKEQIVKKQTPRKLQTK